MRAFISKRSIFSPLPYCLIALMLAACGDDDSSKQEVTKPKTYSKAEIDAYLQDQETAYKTRKNAVYEARVQALGQDASSLWAIGIYDAIRIDRQDQAVKTRAGFDPLRPFATPEQIKRLEAILQPSIFVFTDDTERAKEQLSLSRFIRNNYQSSELCSNQNCQNLAQIDENLIQLKDDEARLKIWQEVRELTMVRKDRYKRLQKLNASIAGNQALTENLAAYFGLSASQLREITETAWSEIYPFYEATHCHIRSTLQREYGLKKVPNHQPIPAHLFGGINTSGWRYFRDAFSDKPNADQKTIAFNQTDTRAIKLQQSLDDLIKSDAAFDDLTAPKVVFRQTGLLPCEPSAYLASGNTVLEFCGDTQDLESMSLNTALQWQMLKTEQPLGSDTQKKHDPEHILARAKAIAGALIWQKSALKSLAESNQLSTQSLEFRWRFEQMTDILIQFADAMSILDFQQQVMDKKITENNYNKAFWQLRTRYMGIKPLDTRLESRSFDAGAHPAIAVQNPVVDDLLVWLLAFHFAENPLLLEHDMIFSDYFTQQQPIDAMPMLRYFQAVKKWLDREDLKRACGW